MDGSRDTVILVTLRPSLTSRLEDGGRTYPTMAIMLLGTVFKAHGCAVSIIDGSRHADYLTRLRKQLTQGGDRVLLVGFSVMTPQVPLALEASKAAKAASPETPVVWGGPHPTLFPMQTVSHPAVDVVVINEGTAAAIALAETFQAGAPLDNIPGIAFKSADGLPVRTGEAVRDDISQLPHLDFSLIDVEHYLDPGPAGPAIQREFPRFDGPIRAMPVLTGLGCPYRCQFCINVILKRRYRFRSAASVVAELKRLIDRYSCNTFIFMDEDFFVNKRRIREFLDLVEEQDLHFNWRMWCRVDHFRDDHVSHDVLQRLDRIGHGCLVMGGESGSQGMLDSLCKGTTVEQILNSLRALEGTRIQPRYSFMVGLENETLEQIRETYNLCLKMRRIRSDVDIAGPFPFRLYPGSPIYGRLAKQTNLSVPDSLEDWQDLFLCNESVDKQNVWAPAAFRRCYPYLDFYFRHALEPPVAPDSPGNVIRWVLKKVSLFRVRHFCWILPLQYWRRAWLNRRGN